jgi:teichuronic acid biosynthesis glycosyltransferase TuaG
MHLLLQPLPVSVVIPTYNAADTLPRAIQSIACQTLLPAEIIIVDDASTDETLEVVEHLSAIYPRLSIKLIRLLKNSGAGTARNAGWQVSRQEFLAFLDSDDSWHPQKLEIQHQWMCKNPNTVISGHLCQVNPTQANLEPVYGTNPASAHGTKLSMRSFLFGNQLSTPSVMLRRKIFERFLEGKRCSEDYLLWTQIVAAHGSAGFIKLPLAFLHKPPYGASGLSGNLWEMQRGEIDSLRRLRQASVFDMGKILWFSIVTVSWLKFVKRLLVRFILLATKRRW